MNDTELAAGGKELAVEKPLFSGSNPRRTAIFLLKRNVPVSYSSIASKSWHESVRSVCG